MMKKLLLTFLVLTAVGCSFKKSSDKAASAAANAATKSRVDEVMADNRYTDRQKVEVALRKGLWDIFIKVLPKVSKAELNQPNKKGQFLVEIAIGTQRDEFLKALFNAGASPYVSFSNKSNLRDTYSAWSEDSLRIVSEARDRVLEQAKEICTKSDLDSLIQFLEENRIPPTLNVCGEFDLFIYTFNYRKVDEKTGSKLMSRYLDHNRYDYETNMQAMLFNAFIFGDEDIWRRVQAHVDLNQFTFTENFFVSLMARVPTKKMLKAYIAKRPNTLQKLRLKIQWVLRDQLKKRTGHSFSKENISDFADLIEEAKFDDESTLIPFVDVPTPPTAAEIFGSSDDDDRPPPPKQVDYTVTSPDDPTIEELLK